MTPEPTIAEGKEFIECALDLKEQVRCPTCEQRVKPDRRRISAKVAEVLIHLYEDGGFLKVKEHGTHEGSLLAYWGLIEPEHKVRPDTGKTGVYRITRLGQEFVEGQITIVKYKHIFNNKVREESGGQVTLEDCLGRPFDLREVLER